MRARCAVASLLVLAVFSLAPTQCPAVDVGYYFNLAGELIDLPYPGTEFYGEVDLTLVSLNNLRIDVNAYRSPGEFDYQGNYLTSPLVAGPNFGIDKFGANSTLIGSQSDYNTFMSLYDVTLPTDWNCSWSGVAGDFGMFELWYKGTGNSRQDPLVIEIAPKSGAVIPTAFEIDSVYDFVELSAQGYYFTMHVGDFTTDPSYWESGSCEVESAFFAVVPEPCTVLLGLVGLAPLALFRRRRPR